MLIGQIRTLQSLLGLHQGPSPSELAKLDASALALLDQWNLQRVSTPTFDSGAAGERSVGWFEWR